MNTIERFLSLPSRVFNESKYIDNKISAVLIFKKLISGIKVNLFINFFLFPVV